MRAGVRAPSYRGGNGYELPALEGPARRLAGRAAVRVSVLDWNSARLWMTRRTVRRGVCRKGIVQRPLLQQCVGR